jgi:two-component system alkaline phosphatase synthesis response regulator PhoP
VEEDELAKILVVDDDAAIRSLLNVVLRAEGHEVVATSDGASAIEQVKKKRFDLVLLDVMMPEMNGHDVLVRMREMRFGHDVPVIMVTAIHTPEEVIQELREGAVDHIAKPFDVAQLVAAVARAVGGSAEEIADRKRILSAFAEVYGDAQRLREPVDDEDPGPGIIPDRGRRWRLSS